MTIINSQNLQSAAAGYPIWLRQQQSRVKKQRVWVATGFNDCLRLKIITGRYAE
jgi:hypothetical protein